MDGEERVPLRLVKIEHRRDAAIHRIEQPHPVRQRLAGKTVAAFHYHDKGSLATIGRAAAVADFGRIHMHGMPAWLTWLFVHLLYLVEFDNRLLVLIQWAYNYITHNRGARLISGEGCK